jgi:integrase
VGRKHDSDIAPGIWKRQGSANWWLRYTVNGKQIRTSLNTPDKAEALAIAEGIRAGTSKSAAAGWDIAVQKYIAKKLAEDTYTERTDKTIRYALDCFKRYCSPSSPSEITTEALKGFYDQLRKPTMKLFRQNKKVIKKAYAEATAQGYVTKVASFAHANRIIVDIPKFKGEASGVKAIIEQEEIDRLIDEAEGFNLKAILHFGFCCGLRKDEIVNIRPEWIDLKTKRLTIPGKESGWQTKSKRSRVIPLREKTKRFLEENKKLWINEKYVIEPTAKGVRYRYDFRRPFREFMVAQGYDKITPHSMRHTYASLLAMKEVSPILIASWTGDRIKTIEKHYLHTQTASPDKIDEVFGDKESETTQHMKTLQSQLAQAISLISDLSEKKGKKISRIKAFEELKENPAFAPLVEEFSTTVMLDKMSDEQREEFLNSLPF